MRMVEGKAAEQEVDYEFFKAGVDGRKEGEVGTDKRFGEIQLLLIFSQCFLFSHHWRHSWGLRGGLHGQAVQEQAEGHEDLCLSHPHQDVRADDCSRFVILSTYIIAENLSSLAIHIIFLTFQACCALGC